VIHHSGAYRYLSTVKTVMAIVGGDVFVGLMGLPPGRRAREMKRRGKPWKA
jgi:hypothetical protein